MMGDTQKPLDKLIILLSQHETDRFSLWCEQQEQSSSLLGFQASKIPGPHGAILTKQLQLEEMAYQLVAGKLKNMEIMEI